MHSGQVFPQEARRIHGSAQSADEDRKGEGDTYTGALPGPASPNCAQRPVPSECDFADAIHGPTLKRVRLPVERGRHPFSLRALKGERRRESLEHACLLPR